MVVRAGGRPVAVPLRDHAVDLAAVDAAVRTETRAVLLCSPNDPTGLPIPRPALRAFAAGLPERVRILLDEAHADLEAPGEDAVGLLSELAALLVFRTFSKAWGMAGLRAGYALAPPAAVTILEDLRPGQGIGAPVQAAVAAALERGEARLARRRAGLVSERERLAEALRDSPLSFPPTAAAFAWVGSSAHDGREIAAHLAAERIYVTPGAAYGDARHVRIALRGLEATERVARSLAELAGQASSSSSS